MTAYGLRMPAGLPGGHSRHAASATIEAGTFDATNSPTAFGTPVVLNPSTGRFRSVLAGDTAASVYGILLRVYPSTGGNGQDPLGVSTPGGPGSFCSIMVRGYPMVLVAGPTAAAKGGAVYMRVANPSAGRPLGGFEAANDTSTAGNTVLLTQAQWMGPADANGNSEIRWNI